MYGEFLPVWSCTWREIWVPLARHAAAPPDLFCDFIRDLLPPPPPPPAPTFPPAAYDEDGVLVQPAALARRNRHEKALSVHAMQGGKRLEAIQGIGTLQYFKKCLKHDIGKEAQAVALIEKAALIIREREIDALEYAYACAVRAFLAKYSLGYTIIPPFTLSPTVTGLFMSLMKEITALSDTDAHLKTLMGDFEDALATLHHARSAVNIKTCLQKQSNLLEAIALKNPEIEAENTLGAACRALKVWPHHKTKESIMNLYKFICDYPGIRHSGTTSSQLRDIETRDLVSVTLVLMSFLPYLSHQIDSERIYERK